MNSYSGGRRLEDQQNFPVTTAFVDVIVVTETYTLSIYLYDLAVFPLRRVMCARTQVKFWRT